MLDPRHGSSFDLTCHWNYIDNFSLFIIVMKFFFRVYEARICDSWSWFHQSG